MAKVRIHEIAKESGFESKEILAKALELGINVKTASSSVDEDVAAAIYEYLQTNIIPQGFAKKEEKKEEEKKPSKQKVENKAKKEEKQKQEESKKEPEIEQVQAPQQATQTVSNTLRRGLVIVKKKKDTVVKNEEVVSNKTTKNIDLKDMFSNAQDDSFKKVKKKDKKPNTPQSKKENAQKMDLLSNQNFAEISLEDEDVVVLPEFSTKTEQAPQVLTQKQPSLLRQSFSKFTENSIQRRARKKPPKKPEKKENAEIKSVEIPKEIRVYEFADKLNKNVSEIISTLFMLGMMTTKNDFLDEDAIEILASEFGIEVNIIDEADEFDYLKNYDAKEDNEEDLSPRAPVITIMGHVDHGKTSLLDYIRNSRVVNAEAGGITQHVGAYMVEKNKRKITFIDTPGHEAFTAMRARGAGITDIVIIVVAADDGVKPQTKEAINHAKAANVPIIIAINKIDKEGANVDMVKTQLSELDIVPSDWGGSYEFVQVSAKKGTGVDELLEIVLLQADILELKANSKAKAKASIIESSLQKGRGPVATVIVQNGTLKIGNTVVAGVAYGKVRALNDDRGNALKEIKPGECGVIVGLSEIAQAGETLIAVQSDKEAREYAAKRYEYNRQKELSKSTKVSIDELSTKIKEGNLKSLPVILKADVQGSLEAIKSSLEKLVNDEIKVNIIHSGIGGISQSDIELASASENSVVLGFNVRPTGEIKEKAKDKGIEIKTYNVIYNLIDDVKALLSGMMSPIISEEQLGQAEIRQVISVPKIGLIAGCMVSEGVINRGAKIRLIRDGVVLFEGSVSSLKRFKDDVKEVAKGFECGVGIEGCTDMKVGDYIESYKEISQMASI